MNLPDASPVLDLIDAFRSSKTMFTAAGMGIFDRLHDAPSTAADMAAQTGAHSGAMERLLDGCTALGLLEKRAGMYHNAPVAETYLWSGSPRSLDGYVRYSDDALYRMWGDLEGAVREGTPRWRAAFGLEGGIFSGFFRTEEAKRAFLRGMHGFGMLTSPRVVGAFDLSAYRRMADLGGATGHLVLAACERYPDLRGVVFDLPEAAALAEEYRALSPVGDRVEVRAGDFFEDDLPQADLYAVGRILHDWSDEKIERLLAKIVRALPANGALLVAEKLLAEDGVGPVAANMQSLNMLVVAEGRERSLSDYTRLLRAAGFTKVDGRRTGAPLDAILARK
jgi:acetylserotonin N-methyltransferase